LSAVCENAEPAPYPRRALSWAAAWSGVLVFWGAGAISAGIYAPDPGSPVYETTALTAGQAITVTRSQVTGNLQSNGNVDLDARSRITGNVAAVGHVHGRQEVTGSVEEGAPPVTLPALPTADQARALANRVFDGDTTFTDAVIDDVVFVAGDARVRGSLDGSGTLIASGNIRLAAVKPGDGEQLAAGTRMSLVALGNLNLEKGRALRGLLLAGHTIELEGANHFDGVLVAEKSIQLEAGAVVTFAPLDQTPPVISALSPANGSLVPSATPTISATLADDLSGVDPTSLTLTVDGADRTRAAQASTSGFTFTPALPLGDGVHRVAVAVRDRAGNLAQAQWSFTTDVTPPTLAFTAPAGQVPAGTAPPVVVAYGDATSGIDLGSLRVSLDATDLSASCVAGPATASCAAAPQPAGSHTLAASIRDKAGNSAAASLTFQVVSPQPAIAITSPADGSYSRVTAIQVAGTVNSVVTAVTVGGQAATLGPPGTFTATVNLTTGVNLVQAVATDATGNQAADSVTITLDTTPPNVTLLTPAPGLTTNQAQVQVTGSASDDSGIATVTVAGQPVTLADGQFAAVVPLGEGANQIVARAVDLAGNDQTAAVTVNRFSVPAVSIALPADLSYVSATTVTVTGSVDAAVSVTVNGVAAVVAGNSFSAAGVPLVEGGNTLTATATDARGRVGIASINVVRDLTPPRVAIYVPADGAILNDSSVTVAGLANDIVAGTVNASNVTVSVNGLAASVANRSFIVPAVPLQPGDNILTAVAVDAGGNRAQASVTVHRTAPAAARITAVSGDGQSAVIGTPVAQPLVAMLLDAAGQPVAGKTVLFRARGNDGRLNGAGRDVAVSTDATGRAQAQFAVGTHAGAGNQIVEATAVGFSGPARFVASALPGSPALIVVDSGDQQLGVAGQALPRPLVAAVVDAGANRLGGVAATFQVVKGAGHFANGLQTLSLATDSDGRLIVPFVSDPTEGVASNGVRASIDALPAGPAAGFVATTLAAGDPAQTTVYGVVLDNNNLPVAGVTVRIRDTALTTVTDAQGLFQIAPAPVGTLKLIVDGSTAQRAGSWPDLEFDLTTVPGRANSLRMPIYLLPLDLVHGVPVDETHGGKLTLPQLPGFALEIQPGSVTFPGGSRNGVVSVTVVHSDRVPMVPNFGQQPRLIVTIQPAGARFEPPARLTLPNVEGFAPGQVTEFYSFDHDLGYFVSIGPGTVSDDGTVITSNAGVGILKAGWHCNGVPKASGTGDACPDCKKCDGVDCVKSPICDFCPAVGSACDGQGHCLTGKELLPLICKRLTTTVQEGPSFTCKKCGTGVWRTYTHVDPHCQNVSLTGTTLLEDVTPLLNECIKKAPDTGLDCPIIGTTPTDPSNGGPCNDHVELCGDAIFFPMGTCRQSFKQVIKVDGCPVETHTFIFTITRTATSCSGELVEQ
jgi:hypothetical protein